MSGKKNGLLRKRLAAWKAHTRNSARTSLPVLIARGSSMAARYSTARMAQAGAFVRDGDLPDHEGWRLGLSMKSLDGASAKRRRLRGAII